jgi:hypothetical protein
VAAAAATEEVVTSVIVRPASGYDLSTNVNYTLVADTDTALSDETDATGVTWDNTPDNPLGSCTVDADLQPSSELADVVLTATNVQAFVHIRAATNSPADRAALVEFTIAGRLFFSDWLQVGDPGGHDRDPDAGPDFTVREYVSGIVRGSSDDGNPLTLAEAESLADALSSGAAVHLDWLVGISSDPGLRMTELWLEVTWDGEPDVELWPLHQRQRGITGLQQRRRHDW